MVKTTQVYITMAKLYVCNIDKYILTGDLQQPSTLLYCNSENKFFIYYFQIDFKLMKGRYYVQNQD